MNNQKNTLPRLVAWTVTAVGIAAVFLGAASFAINNRNYGWGLFLGIPYGIGFVSASILRRWGAKTIGDCMTASAVTSVVLSLGFLVLGKEGVICILMALPLASPLVLFGAWMAYLAVHRADLIRADQAALLLLAALGLGLWFENNHRPTAPTYEVSDSIVISATPDAVWKALITMGSLGQPQDLLFRMGVACPQRVDIYGNGVGAMRVCTLTTGQLEEQITNWEPGRELRWVSISTPPPMKEINPFYEIDPPHLHGFYRSVSGYFELQSLGDNTTRVTRASSYQHHLFPAIYWRIWCDYVAHRGHIHVLSVLKQSAETKAVAGW